MTDPHSPDRPADSPPPAPSGSQPYTAAPPPAYGPPVQQTVPGKTLGIVAFILSFFMQVVALVLGIVALVQSRKAGQKNGFAVAAIIISSVLIVIGVIIVLVFVVPTLSAASTCLADPTATVTIWGVQVPCSQVVTN